MGVETNTNFQDIIHFDNNLAEKIDEKNSDHVYHRKLYEIFKPEFFKRETFYASLFPLFFLK